MIEKEFTIREPKTTIGISILIAFILTVYFALCYYFFTENEDKSSTVLYLIILGFFVFKYMVMPGLTTKAIHLNFNYLKIKHEISIGPFTFRKRWKDLKKLEYISVFKTENGYEVNLWYNKNKIINLFVFDNFDEVIKKAFFFAEKLDIDLLDARERGYHKWIDKAEYKSTGEIVHT